MKTKDRRSPRTLLRAPLALFGLTVAGAASGCLTRPIDPIDTRTTWTSHFKQIRSGVDKIDLLLMLDNSASMADKQAILSEAVPSLVKGLLDPPCVGSDDMPVANQPANPTDTCPAGSARAFDPIFDVHIGIVSSSLGGHGALDCSPKTNYWNPTQNDQGHLLSRLDASNPTQGSVDTYGGKGFLAWDPKQQLTPPGEGSLDTTVDKLRDMVGGVGQSGCGYEAQLESWYRFLVDPEPYGAIALDGNKNVVVSGTDHQLLAERAAFLRPDSMVAILMLTDENDCSTREEGDFPRMNDTSVPMTRARKICETDPDNRCCAPCDQTPADCPADDTCTGNTKLSPEDDPINLRCWDQKRRFGRDFLYPVERYVTALTSRQIPRRNGEMAPNPLFPDDPDGKLNARSPETGLVFLAGIVGVPWQDIARQRADGKPDLLNGLDDKGRPVGGFMSAAELAKRDPVTKQSRWDVILGDPASHVDPQDPFMHESRKERSGMNPITGDPIAPASGSGPTASTLNGHEWNTDAGGIGDLQYACVFSLKTPRPNGGDCAQSATPSDNPLCQDPQSGTYGTTQFRAKGYPGLRELAVLKGMGEQGIVASVCPAQLDTPSQRDYGYTPAIGALIDRLKHKLSGQCLTRPLTPDPKTSQVSCVVIEARKGDGGACCDGVARHDVDATHAAAVAEAKADPTAAGADCFCAIDQLGGDDLKVCQTSTSVVPVGMGGEPVNGWCYVDDQLGAPALLDGCPAGEKYKVRFVGAGQPAADAVTFITCAGDNG